MKKLLQVLGILFLVVVIGVGVLVAYAAYNGSRLDKSSKDFVDRSVPIIAATWSPSELLRRASPELIQATNAHPEQLQQLFDKLSQLGALKQYDGSKGDSNVYLDSRKGKNISAAYTAYATFDHGSAKFSVKLVQKDGLWQYVNFRVDSPALLR